MHPRLSHSSPFTRRSLAHIRSLLLPLTTPTHEVCTGSTAGGRPGAAVLIPLCNVNGAPSILFEVRGNTRQHAREISFPGGGIDPHDTSPAAAARRETAEELGLPTAGIEVLGRLAPAEHSNSGRRVWPFIGWVHTPTASLSPSSSFSSSAHLDSSNRPFSSLLAQPTIPDNAPDEMSDTPLPSLSIQQLTLSPCEVSSVFCVPLSALPTSAPHLRNQTYRSQPHPNVNPRLRPALFRDEPGKPYYAVDITDRLAAGAVVDPNKVSRKEVWGLTGWYLNLFMRVLGWWTPPPMPASMTAGAGAAARPPPEMMLPESWSPRYP